MLQVQWAVLMLTAGFNTCKDGMVQGSLKGPHCKSNNMLWTYIGNLGMKTFNTVFNKFRIREFEMKFTVQSAEAHLDGSC